MNVACITQQTFWFAYIVPPPPAGSTQGWVEVDQDDCLCLGTKPVLSSYARCKFNFYWAQQSGPGQGPCFLQSPDTGKFVKDIESTLSVSATAIDDATVFTFKYYPGNSFDFPAWAMEGTAGTHIGVDTTGGGRMLAVYAGSGSGNANFYLEPGDFLGGVGEGSADDGSDLSYVDFSQIKDRTLEYGGLGLFKGCKFTDTNLGLNVGGSDFTDDDLSTVITDENSIANGFEGTYGGNTIFVNAKVPYSLIKNDWTLMDLTDATIVDIPNDVIRNLNAQSAPLTNVVLSGIELTKANFNNAILNGADLSGSDLTGAHMEVTQLAGAGLTYAILEGASLAGASLGKADGLAAANLTGAYMPDAVLTGADLNGAKMAYVHLYGSEARVDNADLESADLSHANLGSMNLSQANLQGVTLDGANLIDCNLSGVNLGAASHHRGSSLVKASLQGANFAGAILAGANLAGAAVALDSGVILFTLDAATYRSTLEPGDPGRALRNAFSKNGYGLDGAHAAVSVEPDGSGWTVTEDNKTASGDPVFGYIGFSLVESGSTITVYGSSVSIRRLNSKNEEEAVTVTVRPTNLEREALDDLTTCPNGQTYGENKTAGLTWAEMMTAGSPASPPRCIPSLTSKHWCPQPKMSTVEAARLVPMAERDQSPSSLSGETDLTSNDTDPT